MKLIVAFAVVVKLWLRFVYEHCCLPMFSWKSEFKPIISPHLSLFRSSNGSLGPVSQNNLSFCLKFSLNGDAKITLGTT